LALKKLEKLKNRNAFRTIHKLKVLSRNAHFKLLVKKRNDGAINKGFPKVAFVISRKKLKLAVKRNKAKRRLEEAYRTCKADLIPTIFAFEYLIFFLEASILEVSFDTLKKLLLQSFIKSQK